MLSINGKKFMNISEAVQWLLDNNALPFQSTANYVADTVIAKTTIINPSPAEIKIGSLVLFADGKVGTVSGITANGFMVGAESTDLSDGVPHITDITISATDHLIFTMSEGDPIDAGLIKEVSSFSIDASQHLIVNYNDGTTQDLGAIFQGNINISGTLTATHAMIFEEIEDSDSHNRFTGGSLTTYPIAGITYTYARWSLSGTHLMIVVAGTAEENAVVSDSTIIASCSMPQWILDKLVPFAGVSIDLKELVNRKSTYEQDDLGLITLRKEPPGLIIRNVSGPHTFTSAGNFRLQYDLIVDND